MTDSPITNSRAADGTGPGTAGGPAGGQAGDRAGAPEAPVADLVRSWIDGWVVSRQAADPVEAPWGWSIDVGTPKEVDRQLLPAGDEATVRKAAETCAAPGRWLKVFLPGVPVGPGDRGAPERLVGPWLGPEWELDIIGFLMTTPLVHTPLEQTHARVPDDYRQRTWLRGGVIRTAVFAPDGSLAARGQMAPTGPTAVADQIWTSPHHRRKGLGSLVMRTLHNTALEHGARTGVLVASEEGRALYESIGWHTHAPMVSTYVPSVNGS
ncbi:GNAT family N-acetyltransferase [Streptomyces monticola]|uniref:GNAT family N-acetyltransferase n=1 Tax=Streptomyces monticola TaxID=2666263 RepID=A0ABW2JFM4_9ACTN